MFICLIIEKTGMILLPSEKHATFAEVLLLNLWTDRSEQTV